MAAPSCARYPPLTMWQNATIMGGMHTYASIVDDLGGYRDLAAALGIESSNTVLYWQRPGRRIPSSHWPAIADLPAARAKGITLDVLARLPPNPAPAADRAADIEHSASKIMGSPVPVRRAVA